jgi:zinc D-Ala-D-Ala dipeptidase
MWVLRLLRIFFIFAFVGTLAGQKTFQIQPLHPVEELRKEAAEATPPVESGPFRAPDLIDLATLGADFHFDIRYATANNFLGTPVYPEARAFLERPAAEALLEAAKDLKANGYGVLVHDAYRPWYITKVFWDATPPSLHTFVANPAKGSKHNRGCAIDMSIYELSTGKPAEMPSGYDEMTERAHPGYTGGPDDARRRRDMLRHIMEAHGFSVDPGEWWHYDFKDWAKYPIINLPFDKIPRETLKRG